MEGISELAPLRAIENTQVAKTKKNDDPDRRLSVERIYQKKTQLEHILLRPDTYIGSVEPVTQLMWVFDEEVGMNSREVTFVPGLYKIFDEILVNAADNKQRDKNMTCIKINIDPENNIISVWNNGKGIPVVEHKVEKVYVPALIFGQLLTSSNYDDDQKKVTGGRNGYGAKLCNIFSNKFTVETACQEYKKQFKQTWSNNMSNAGDSKITFFNGEDYTCITFQPDLSKFKMQILDKDIIALMSRRAYDIAGASKGVKVFLNGKKLPISGFRSYVDQYTKDKVDETGNSLQIIHEVVNDRWEVCLTMSEKGFQQISFVNSIATTKGGRHVDFVADQIITKLIEVVKRKNKGGIAVKPFQVKNHMWLFVNALIENPTFDSQTKENMTLQAKSFGSKCPLSEKFVKAAVNCGIVESILNWVKFKAQIQLNKKCSAVKHTKIKGIPKLDDANDAGSKFSQQCTLILTEGDSAKTLAVSGLGVVGRDRYGVFPLKGKMLNVREASHKQIMENAEINNIIKIMGLQYKKNYDDEESLRTLRYGKLMIMTDQDQDGSHIKGLLINFIHHNWPSLLRHKFLEEFITPLVKVSKNKQEMSFYSVPEFEEWKNSTDTNRSWKVKYYKGLGTSTAKEAKEYFADMNRHRIPFKYAGPQDDAAITLAFSKKQCDDRKEWLTNFMVDRRQRRLLGLPEDYLYGSTTKQLTYNEFINKELILFSNSDNERSIPSLVDGLKPGQRKVLFTCFKRNDKREVKVAQLAGSVAEMSAYHHGENSLMSTIINLAQNFVGSNNVNLLQPIGQFGTRLHGGKDAASPRYIFTMLSPLARLLFPAVDDHVLKFICDDNQRVEPEWYMPIIPMVLVNGAEGIGTGWACKIPNYDARELVNNIRRMLDGDEPLPMLPSYKNFKGIIQELGLSQYVVNGEVSVIDETTIEITELPAKTWTQSYKEQVLDPMSNGTEKTAPLIQDYREYHTDTTVRYVVTMTEQKLAEAEAAGLHKVFKLQTPLTCNSMVLFDHVGCLKKYESVMDILKEFFDLRLQYYSLRKEWHLGMLTAEASKLTNQARFILEKIEGKIVLENKPKKEIIQLLADRGYDSDPVKAWKTLQEKDESEENEEEAETAASASGPDFNYLLNMPMWYLTKEKKDELCKQRDAKEEELMSLKRKSPEDLWKDDLAAFIEQLEIVEAKQREDDASGIPVKGQKGKGGKPRKAVLDEIMPSPHGRRIVPRVTTAMKAEATKKVRKRIKGDDIAVKIEFGDDKFGDDNGDSPAQEQSENLTARLTKKVKTEGGPKGGKGKKQAVLPFKPIKKRNPWSDSESDDDESAVEPPTCSEKPQRASKPKKRVDFSDDDDTLEHNQQRSDLSDEDFAIDSDGASEVKPGPKPKAVEKKVKAPKEKSNLKASASPVEALGYESGPSAVPISKPAAEKPPPKKRAAPKKAAGNDKQQPSIRDALSKPKASKAKASKAMSLDMVVTADKTAPKAMTSKAMSLDFDLNVDVETASKAMTSKAMSMDLDVDVQKPALDVMARKAASLDVDVNLAKPTEKQKISKTASQDHNKKPAAKNAQKPRKRKAYDSESSSSDMDFGSKKSTAMKKKGKADDDSFHVILTSDSDSDAATPARKAPRALPGRAKRPVKYAFDSENTDDDMFC